MKGIWLSQISTVTVTMAVSPDRKKVKEMGSDVGGRFWRLMEFPGDTLLFSLFLPPSISEVPIYLSPFFNGKTTGNLI